MKAVLFKTMGDLKKTKTLKWQGFFKGMVARVTSFKNHFKMVIFILKGNNMGGEFPYQVVLLENTPFPKIQEKGTL